MTSPEWSVPWHCVDAETAKRRILSQHEQIRALLLRAAAVAEASLSFCCGFDDRIAIAEHHRSVRA